MKIWTETVWRPYVSRYEQSDFLLNAFACHKFPVLVDGLKEIGKNFMLISGRHTFVSKSYNAEKERLIKSGIRKNYTI